jgi:hypothetical protein
LPGAAILDTVSGGRRGIDRHLAALASVLLSVAAGIAGNGLFNDFGYAAAVVAAVAGIAATAVLWLRGLPPEARLIRYANGGLLALGFGAAVAAAFSSGHLSTYATLAATGLTLAALLSTPGVAIANTLFRVALVGFAVAWVGGTIAEEWHNGGGIVAAVLPLTFVALTYFVARDEAPEIIADAEAGKFQDLGARFLVLGGMFGIVAILELTGGEPVVAALLGPLAVAAASLGWGLLTGGRYRFGAAVLLCGIVSVIAGTVLAAMPGSPFIGMTVVGIGFALAAVGAKRLDAVRRLGAWGRYLTGAPDVRTEPEPED